MKEITEQPKLLGFVGHRDVPDVAGLREAMRREILAMKELLGKRMIAITSAAAGADLLFLKTCVELRIPTIVILPLAEGRLAGDYRDAEEWAMAQRLCSVALAKYFAPGGSEPYQLVSRIMLEWADAFLFAWDGGRPKGAGGTGEAAEEARDLGIPSRVIDPTSLATRWETPPDPDRKARHGFDTRADLLDFLDARFSNYG